jgi:hypothetical protein
MPFRAARSARTGSAITWSRTTWTPTGIFSTLVDNALIQPESRRAFTRLLDQGWTDALRKLHPDGPLWTFWDYKFERWRADKGMRLDHLLLSSQMSDRLVDGGVDRWVCGEINASDHARRGSCWISNLHDDRQANMLNIITRSKKGPHDLVSPRIPSYPREDLLICFFHKCAQRRPLSDHGSRIGIISV